MKSKYSVEKIKINYDTDPKDYSPFVLDKIEEFYAKVQKIKIPWKVVEDLQKLIVKFPTVPVFKNYLATAYEKLNKEDLLKRLLSDTVEKHPDYGFGRVTLAKFYIDRDDLEMAENVFRKADNISGLYPEQKIFHITEVQYFYYMRAIIELKRGNDKHTEELIELLYSINAEDKLLDDLKTRRISLRLLNLSRNKENSIEPVPVKVIVKDSASEMPVFRNKIMYKLYTDKFFLADRVIEEIRQLDRDSAIQDLKMMLKDAENRYHYYLNSEKYEFFPIHALLMLKELKAEEALEYILDFLRNDEEFLEFWLDDFLNEEGWEVIFSLSQNKLETLKSFLLEAGIYRYAKYAVFSAMVQFSFHNRDEVTGMWKECLDVYTEATHEDNIISSEFFTFFVIDILNFDRAIFKEGVKKLFEKGVMDEMISGNFEEILKHDSLPERKSVSSLSEIYKKYKY